MMGTHTFLALFFFAVFSGTQSQWILNGDYEYWIGLKASDMYHSWHSARSHCQYMGGDLVSITSDAEHDWIVTQVSNSEYRGITWIGLNYLDMKTWKWSDGETAVPNHWASGFPTPVPDEHGHKHLCVCQDANDHKWQNEHCDVKGTYICKRKPNQEGPITDSPTPSVGGYCPHGYFTSDEKNNKCYKVVQVDDISSQGFDFQQAQAECRKGPGFNPDLVSIHSSMENALLMTQIRKNGYGLWIGLHTLNIDGYDGWRWPDNSATDYHNWAYWEPAFYGGQCAELWLRNADDVPGTWNNLDCYHKRGYICQTFKSSDDYIATPTPTTPNVCRSDYTPFWYGCYKIVKDGLKTWDEASQYCKNEGGDLVSIQTSPENSAIFVKLAELSLDVWIGLRDVEHNGQYQWSDKWAVTYTNWGSNQPNQPEYGGCAYMENDGKWYDDVCTNHKAFVCKISSVEPITQPPELPGYCPGEKEGRSSWIHHGQFCYLFEPYDYQKWSDANAKCAAHSATSHLVSIHDHFENEFILKKMKENYFYGSAWIGMFRSRSGRQWHWADKSPVQYENWAPGEPNGNHTQEDCGEMYVNNYPGKWNDKDCNRGVQPYICKSLKTPMGILPSTKNGTCPEDWVPYGSKCYMFEANHASDWQTALDDCTSQGGSKATLVTLHSFVDSEFVHKSMQELSEVPDPLNYWIGLVKDGSLANGNDFRWMDGSTLDFKAWEYDEPNDLGGNENCVSAYSKNMKWNDIHCDNRRAYVCQVDMDMGNGLSAGEIVGIIFGVLAIVVLLAALAVVILDKFQVISLSKVQNDTKVLFGIENSNYEKDSATDA